MVAGEDFLLKWNDHHALCSPYFRQLFKRLGGEKTVIFLKDVEPKHLELLLEYMYKGEIKVEVGEEEPCVFEDDPFDVQNFYLFFLYESSGELVL